MRYLKILVCLFCLSCSNKNIELLKTNEKPVNLVDFVNPLMGTDSDYSLSNGNTYPVIATPWAMNFWSPMTAKMGDG